MADDLRERLESLRIEREDEERSPKSARVWVGIAVAVALAAVAWWLLRDRPVEVRSAVVEEGVTGSGGAASVLNASGYVTARREATVSSKVTGKVVEVLVEEGMSVEEGQVLARLDDSQVRLALGLAEAQLAAAEKSLAETEARRREAEIRQRRIHELVAGGVASAADRDAVDAEVDALAARIAAQGEEIRAADRAVALARQDVEDTVIRAPFSGVAISKDAQPGEMISPVSAGGGFTRTGISTVVDMSSLEIEVDVNEAYIQRVRTGQSVQATLDAYPDAPFPAHVITTIPAADREKATVTVRVGFDSLDPRILPDMGVKVAFLADPESAEGAEAGRAMVRIRRSAVRGDLGNEFVFVVRPDATVERRAVRLAAGGRDPAEIVAGVAAGERVVVEAPAELAAGDRVTERRAD